MKYVLYTRTSTKLQKNGIDAQRKTATQFIKSSDTIIKEFTEQESGRKTNRVELNNAIDYCIDNDCTLLIARLDRLSRNASFTMKLMDSKIEFVCCDMPHANSLTIGIMSLLAQSEAEKISSNTKLALQVLKDKGVKLGKNNLTKEGSIVGGETLRKRAVKQNHQATKIIVRLRGVKLTYDAIAKELNADGYRTATGGLFTKQTVSRLYKRML